MIQSQLLRCDARKQEILAELNKSKDLMRNQDQLRRNIEDNLNYRKTKAEVDALTREIDLVQERIMEIGGISKVEGELRKVLKERERLLSEVYMILTGILSVNLFDRVYSHIAFHLKIEGHWFVLLNWYGSQFFTVFIQ